MVMLENLIVNIKIEEKKTNKGLRREVQLN